MGIETAGANYAIADVFTDTRFNGAQVAVFPEARALSGRCRQQIAAELNLWATVFVEQRDSGEFLMGTYTPRGEAAFGAHTALAAAAVLADTGRISPQPQARAPLQFESADGQMQVFVEAAAGGLVRTLLSRTVRRDTAVFVPERAELASLLGLPERQLHCSDFRPLFANVDHNYLVVPVRSWQAVRDAVFDLRAWSTSSALSMATHEILLFAPQAASGSANFQMRLFGPHLAPADDPPVGAAVPAFVCYLAAHEHVRRGTQSFALERGVAPARVSRIEVEMDHRGAADIGLRVGGYAVISGRGRILLD